MPHRATTPTHSGNDSCSPSTITTGKVHFSHFLNGLYPDPATVKVGIFSRTENALNSANYRSNKRFAQLSNIPVRCNRSAITKSLVITHKNGYQFSSLFPTQATQTHGNYKLKRHRENFLTTINDSILSSLSHHRKTLGKICSHFRWWDSRRQKSLLFLLFVQFAGYHFVIVCCIKQAALVKVPITKSATSFHPTFVRIRSQPCRILTTAPYSLASESHITMYRNVGTRGREFFQKCCIKTNLAWALKI